MFKKRVLALAICSAVPTLGVVSLPAVAQVADGAIVEEIVTTGTRRKARSADDTVAPVDVISGSEFTDQATSDISDLIRTVVPSYQVNTQPISDAATIVRPANLRGLSPDATLVLLNGKRRHRAAVIAFLGGGIADGAHGPDIGVFPSIGLKQVEVLRDGASSQYGSDAIAGVINFVLKDDAEGGTVELKVGSTYEGDGDNYRFAGNIGLPLGSDGFVNISAEFGETDATDRSVQRTDAAGLIAAGNTGVQSLSVNTLTTDHVQIWGQPNINDDLKIFVNSGIQLSDTAELYAFGNYAERQVEGGFFFRNPTNRGGVFAGPTVDAITGAADPNGVASVLVGDLSVNTAGDCPAGIPLTGTNGVIPDPTVLASVTADPNCFSFVELFPGGFVPRFGGDTEDRAIVIGLRGELDWGTGLTYDVSYSYGYNSAAFFINNTINASLGPDTPTGFRPGVYEQTDNNVNLDFSYALPVEGFASDLSIAFGFEYRDEQFDITAGDPASFQIGPLAAPSAAFPTGQGFSSSSNGFGGFTQSTSDSQDNIALYVDLEADLTDQFTVQGAVRYEDFDAFGSTTEFKVGGLYKVTDNFRVRGTYSTGFHAPTTGQANVTNISTAFVGGVLADQGTLPLSSAAGQFVNSQLPADQRFALGPEEATNFSAGVAFGVGDASVTLDYFRIEVDGRIAITDQQDFRGLLAAAGSNAGIPDSQLAGLQTSQLLNLLDTNGVLTAANFAGSEDLTTFGFFANDFDTETQGLDLVVNKPLDIGFGSSSLSLALNYTDTEVSRRGRLGDTRLQQLEENLPNWKGNLSFKHEWENWRGIARINYHSGYYEAHLDSGGLAIFPGAEFTLDIEVTTEVQEGLDLTIGAANLFDEFPDVNAFAGVAGSQYPATAPFGYSGGQYYLRARYSF